jgi:predicted enzyme related to lactoylglutathione lyase
MERVTGIGGVFFAAADPEGNGIQLWQAAGADAGQP